MAIKVIQFIKHGVSLREFTDDYYQFNWQNGAPCILNKDDRTVCFYPSPNYYDYVEISTIDEEEGE